MWLRIKTLLPALSATALCGCVAAKLAIGGEDATNISIVHPGAYRKNIELFVGKSYAERISPQSERYKFYQYDAGTERNVPASSPPSRSALRRAPCFAFGGTALRSA